MHLRDQTYPKGITTSSRSIIHSRYSRIEVDQFFCDIFKISAFSIAIQVNSGDQIPMIPHSACENIGD